MSAAPELLERFSEAEHRSRDRFDRMIDAIVGRIKSGPPSEAWEAWLEEFDRLIPEGATGEHFEKHRFEIFQLIRRGYRLVLWERSPFPEGIRVPQSKEEWAELPDIGEEFQRRRKAQ